MNIAFNRAISLSFVGRFLAQIQIAVFGLVIASLLTKESFGLFQQILSFSLVSVSIARIGLEIITQLEITKINDLKSIDLLNIDLIKIKIITSMLIVSPVLITLILTLIGFNFDSYLIFLLISYSFFLGVNKYITDAVMIYSLRIIRSLIIVNLSAFLRLCLVFYLIYINHNNITAIVFGMLIIELLVFLYLIFFYKIFSSNLFSLSLASLTKDNKRYALHQYGDVLTSLMLSMAGGVIVLSFFQNLELLASYTFILAITLGVFSGGSLNSMLEPILNTLLLRKLHANNNNFFEAKIEETLAAWCSLCVITNLFFGLCIFVFMGIINEQFLELKYSGEIPKILVFYISISLCFWTYQYSSWALLNKRLDITRNSGMISGILHFLFIAIFTYFFGVDGALGAYILANIIKSIIMHFYLGRPKFLQLAIRMSVQKIYSFALMAFLIFISFTYSNHQYYYLISFFSLLSSLVIVLKLYITFNNTYLKEINT